MENFRPGTMEEWDWLAGAARDKPLAVMLRVSGYGQTGPYRRRPGFSHIAHAIGGLSYLAGISRRDTGRPRHGAAGRLHLEPLRRDRCHAGVRHKEATGRGQVIDVGIYEAVFRQMDELAAAYGLFGKVREREGAGSFAAVPHGHFRAQGRQVGGDRLHHRQDV